jgi:hypothetical protein
MRQQKDPGLTFVGMARASIIVARFAKKSHVQKAGAMYRARTGWKTAFAQTVGLKSAGPAIQHFCTSTLSDFEIRRLSLNARQR